MEAKTDSDEGDAFVPLPDGIGDLDPDALEGSRVRVTYDSVHTALAADRTTITGRVVEVDVTERVGSPTATATVDVAYDGHDRDDRFDGTVTRRLEIEYFEGEIHWVELHGKNGARWHRLDETGGQTTVAVEAADGRGSD